MTTRELPLAISHATDFRRRYPGEVVAFYTRVEVLRHVSGYRLSVGLPQGVTLMSYRAPPAHGDVPPQIAQWEGGGLGLMWQLDKRLKAGACYEYEVQVRVASAHKDRVLQSRAAVSPKVRGGGQQAEETACVKVLVKGQYLRHLPALYEDDELMGRFLMLFEGFWEPIEKVVDQLPFYLDPRTAPPDLLPWLASWFDLVLDERWPEEKRRRLLRSAVSLYRKRGTCQGLREYLEVYTDEVPQIIEHRARNFILGPTARLGPAIALGTQNVPHTFTVILRLPPAEAKSAREARRREEERRRVIERIIEAEKPAHTAYSLQIEII